MWLSMSVKKHGKKLQVANEPTYQLSYVILSISLKNVQQKDLCFTIIFAKELLKVGVKSDSVNIKVNGKMQVITEMRM